MRSLVIQTHLVTESLLLSCPPFYKVTNDIRALNFTTVIKVPVQLGDRNIWADSTNLQVMDRCGG